MVGYDEAIEAAIEKEASVIGEEAAIEAAQDIDGANIDDKGNVISVGASGTEVLDKMIDKYTSIGGAVTASLIARKLNDIGADGLDLPESIEERM